MADDKEIARRIVDQQEYWGGTFGINESALSVEMANYVMNNPGVVYWVLVLLQERGYAAKTIIKVTRDFIDQTVQSVFINIGLTPNGKILVEKINQIIKCDVSGNAAAARCLKIQTVINTGAKAVGEVGKVKTESVGEDNPRKLSDVEMNWYVNYDASKDVFLGGVKKPFRPEVCWQLPRKGSGYVVYSPNDLTNEGRKSQGKRLLNDKYGFDQIGTKETIEGMIRIAREWNALHPDRLLQYGDISRPGGINTPDHGTHNTGKAFDMRPLRNDAQLGNVPTPNDSSYHRDLTKEFILLVRKLYPINEFYYNDKQIYNDAEFKGFVSRSDGHDNHLHVMFPGGKEK